MISSMTAFARVEHECHLGRLIWEIRSVNQRYLEVNFKTPEFCKSHEFDLRERLRQHITRGKLECSLRFDKSPQSAPQLTLNRELLAALIAANRTIAEQLQEVSPEKASFFLQWPGVIESAEMDKEAFAEAIMHSFSMALEQLMAQRQKEGSALKLLIEQRLDTLANIHQQTRQVLPDIIARQKQKLLDRFAELQLVVDAERIEQEVVLLAQKIDVDEELDRLATHSKEVRHILAKGGACGRKLDFLMQELNREANTLGSKSINTQTTQASIELKVAIEQMREQIQNIE